MASWQASQCLLPCVQDRHPTYFSWTDKHCTNKPFYALNLRMMAQHLQSRSQADPSSGPACMSSSVTGSAQLLNPIMASTPEVAARYKPEASTPLHKAKLHLKHHWRDPWTRSPNSFQWRSDSWAQSGLRHLDLAKQCHPNQASQFEAGSPLLLAAEVHLQQLPSTSRK